MAVTDEDIEAFIASRKEGWRSRFRTDPAQAARLLRKHGKTSQVDALFQGLQQGASHGFADEVERATTGGPAKNHILAQASAPWLYLLGQLGGLSATGGLLRGTGGAVGKARSAPFRRGGGSVAAGGQKRAIENAAKAKDIENAWGNFPLPAKTDPRVRALVMDAGHGAAVGYGGIDPTRDEDMLSRERAERAAIGVTASLGLAPLTVSGGVAATNAPLLWGGRRIGSAKMLEPQGVSRSNPRGNPRASIEIARSRDESAARERMPRDTASDAVGIINRDKARPLDSEQPHMRRLADQALEPIARDRVAELRRLERNEAADAMEAAYPTPGAQPRMPFLTAREKRVHALIEQGLDPQSISQSLGQPLRMTQVYIRKLEKKFGAAGIPLSNGQTPGSRFVDMALGDTAARVSRPRPGKPAIERTKDIAREIGGPPAAKPSGQGDLFNVADDFVPQMVEAVVRQDARALASWMSTLEAAARRDNTVLPRVRAAVARQLAINERTEPGMNNTDEMRQFLHALGMSGNKAKGIPNVLEAARRGPRERYNSERYQAAIKRTSGTKGPQLRERHATALRDEMATYQPGAYTGPWDPRMGQPLVLRGDDQARFIAPWDFFRKGRVSNREVSLSGWLSGPFAWGGEQVYNHYFEHPGEWNDRPDLDVIEGEAREVPARPRAQAQPQPEPPPGILPQIAPPEPENPVVQQAARQGALDAPMEVREAQSILAGVAGVPLDRYGADNRLGRETRNALLTFQRAAQIDQTGELDETTIRRLRQLRDGQLPVWLEDRIRARLGER